MGILETPMRLRRHWKLGQGPTVELIAYAPEQEPPSEDIEHFIHGAKTGPGLLPLQTRQYVLRETRQTLSWLSSYIRCEFEDLAANFVREDKSFSIALLEHPDTSDRSVSFRLSTAGLGGHTEWQVSLRRVRFRGDNEHFLCAEQ